MRPSGGRLRRALAWGSAVAVFAGTVTAFVAVSARENTFEHRRAEAFADRAAAAVAAVLQSSTSTFAGAGALSVGGRIDPAAFQAFSTGVIRHSSLDAVALSEVVPAGDRAAFEATIGKAITDRGPNGLGPAASRPQYFPVRFAVPDDATRRALIGFDIGGDPQRAPALARATATNEPQSAPVRLAPSNRPGLFVVYPVVVGSDTVGYISAAFLGANLEPLITRLLPSGSSFEVRATDGLVLASHGKAPFEATARARVAGTNFTVAANDGVGPGTAVPFFVLGGGLALALFLAEFYRRTFKHERLLASVVAAAESAEHRASSLLSLSTTMSRTLTAEEVTEVLLAWGRDLLSARSGFVARRVENDRFERVGGRSLTLAGLDFPAARGGIPEQAISSAAATRAPVWVTEGPDIALVLPLIADDALLGIAAFEFHAPVAPDDARRTLAIGVAPLAARALVRAGRREKEHEVALALQARLLPASLPAIEGFEIASRYLAATEGIEVGGDWYDVIQLPSAKVLFTVGDVVGRGAAAAALMGQLRTLMHEAALREADPSATVASLDGIAARTSEAFASTCVAAEIDPTDGAIAYCRAGHPWPLIVGPESSRWLDHSGGAPLGVADTRPDPATERLQRGETLVLFTDGAVERRGEDVSVGLARLRAAAVSAAKDGPDAVCDAILQSVSSSGRDDVVLLVTRRN